MVAKGKRRRERVLVVHQLPRAPIHGCRFQRARIAMNTSGVVRGLWRVRRRGLRYQLSERSVEAGAGSMSSCAMPGTGGLSNPKSRFRGVAMKLSPLSASAS